MKTHQLMTSALSLALALATAAAPAFAGGDVIYNSGIRQSVPAAIPVPAPVPVPDEASGYYVRVDAAYSSNSVDRYSESNSHLDMFRSDQGLSNFGRYGIGAGYHFSRWIRADVTVDIRNDVNSKAYGTVNYGGVQDAGGYTIKMRDTVSDNFKTKNYTGLFNGYLDLPVTPTITPYVGAGIGWVLHTSPGRTVQVETVCVDTLNCDPSLNSARQKFNPSFGGLNTTSYGKGSKQNDLQMAAALMAGVTFNVSTYGRLDLGYRLLHLDGTTFTTAWTGTPNPKITIPDQNIHEIRVGYRYDIN